MYFIRLATLLSVFGGRPCPVPARPSPEPDGIPPGQTEGGDASAGILPLSKAAASASASVS